jgi:hypothetical protein
MMNLTEKQWSRIKRGNVVRMCRRHGSFLGHAGETQYWVEDGQVWAVGRQTAEIWGCYFDFRHAVRAGQLAGFVEA